MCSQSEMPAEAKMLPLYVLAALKNAVMRDGVEVRKRPRKRRACTSDAKQA